MDNQPTVVIGAGIIGLSIALTLQQRGAQVLLLDAAEVGAGASSGNAGHLATEQVYPVADIKILKSLPAMLRDPLGPLRIDWRYLPQWTPWALRAAREMLPTHAEKIHQALLNINAHSLPAWQQFARQWGLEQWVRVQGSLLVCEKETSAAALREHGAKLNAIGVQNQWLSVREIHEREPALALNQCGGLFYPETGHVTDLQAVIRMLLQHFIDAGGRVQTHCKVASATVEADGSIRLDSTQGSISAGKVVLSAGAHSKKLAKQLTGISVPLDTERGYHLMLPNEGKRLSVPVSSADRRFIMTPMDNGLRLAGTVEYAGLEAPPNMERARNLLTLAQGMLQQNLDTADAAEWMGFRPTIADSLPVIDRHANVFLAFGHQHLGLTQAASTAAAVAALFFGEPWPFDLRPMSVLRFL